MGWLAENWFWLLILVFFFWMHRPGHGCHGGHNHGEQHHQNEAQHND